MLAESSGIEPPSVAIRRHPQERFTSPKTLLMAHKESNLTLLEISSRRPSQQSAAHVCLSVLSSCFFRQ